MGRRVLHRVVSGVRVHSESEEGIRPRSPAAVSHIEKSPTWWPKCGTIGPAHAMASLCTEAPSIECSGSASAGLPFRQWRASTCFAKSAISARPGATFRRVGGRRSVL